MTKRRGDAVVRSSPQRVYGVDLSIGCEVPTYMTAPGEKLPQPDRSAQHNPAFKPGWEESVPRSAAECFTVAQVLRGLLEQTTVSSVLLYSSGCFR